jgi:VanZ family protein
MVKSQSARVYLIGRILSVIVAIGIMVLSFMPSRDLGGITSRIPFADKGAHAIAYAVFGFFLFLAINPSAKKDDVAIQSKTLAVMKIILVLLVGILLGLLIELFQPVFGRGMELADLIADAIGTLTGALLALVLLRLGQYVARRRLL